MYNRLITIYIVILGFIIPLSGYAQPKYEIRATWLTTLGGLDWPSHKATSAKTIELQRRTGVICNTPMSLRAVIAISAIGTGLVRRGTQISRTRRKDRSLTWKLC